MVRSFAPESTQQVVTLIQNYARHYLAEEYFTLCKKLVARLEQHAEKPLLSQSPEVWAASVIHAISAVNFLFDKAHPLYVQEASIAEHFQVDAHPVAEQSIALRGLLTIRHFDPEFSTNQLGIALQDDLVKVDEFIVPMDVLPGKYQQMVRNARSTGKDVRFLLES